MPKPENILPFQFPKGTTGNPNGAPPKKVTAAVNRALDKLGVERATNADIEEAFRRMLNLNTEELTALANDFTMPILICTTARLILDKPEYIDSIIDRVAGKARQSIVTEDSSGEVMPITLYVGDKPMQPKPIE